MLKLFYDKLFSFSNLSDAISKQHQQSVVYLNVYFRFQAFQVLFWSMGQYFPGEGMTGLSKVCFAGSESVADGEGAVCSFHLILASRTVSPMYLSPHVHSPSYITHETCSTRSFNGNNERMFLVSQITLN